MDSQTTTAKSLNINMDHIVGDFIPPGLLNISLLAFLPLSIGYLLCYFSCSYLWIILLTVVIAAIKGNSFLDHEKRTFREMAQKVISLRRALSAGAPNDPNEAANWINKVTIQMWPYVTDYLEQMLKSEVERVFSGFKVKVTKVSLGSQTPQVSSIACHDPEVKDAIKLDVDVTFEGDGVVELEKFGLYGGIKNISARGRLWVQLEELYKTTPPFVGAISLCFYQDPQVTYDFTELAVILDIETVRNLIRHEIAQKIVYPNKYIIPLPPIQS